MNNMSLVTVAITMFVWVCVHTVPPDILDYPTSTDMVIREGSNVTLKCAATGSPTPTITWRREGGELIPLPNGAEGKFNSVCICVCGVLVRVSAFARCMHDKWTLARDSAGHQVNYLPQCRSQTKTRVFFALNFMSCALK